MSLNLHNPKTVRMLALGAAGLIGVVYLMRGQAAAATDTTALDPSTFPVEPDPTTLDPGTSAPTVDLSPITDALAGITDILSTSYPTPTPTFDTDPPPYWTVPAGGTLAPNPVYAGTPAQIQARILGDFGRNLRITTGPAGQQPAPLPGNPSGPAADLRGAIARFRQIAVPTAKPKAATAKTSKVMSLTTRTTSGAVVQAPAAGGGGLLSQWKPAVAPGKTPAISLTAYLK